MAGLGLAPVWAEQLAAAVFTQRVVALAVFDTDLRVIATNVTAEAFPRTPMRVGDDADALQPSERPWTSPRPRSSWQTSWYPGWRTWPLWTLP